jgi:hypothetical protein
MANANQAMRVRESVFMNGPEISLFDPWSKGKITPSALDDPSVRRKGGGA